MEFHQQTHPPPTTTTPKLRTTPTYAGPSNLD